MMIGSFSLSNLLTKKKIVHALIFSPSGKAVAQAIHPLVIDRVRTFVVDILKERKYKSMLARCILSKKIVFTLSKRVYVLT